MQEHKLHFNEKQNRRNLIENSADLVKRREKKIDLLAFPFFRITKKTAQLDDLLSHVN